MADPGDGQAVSGACHSMMGAGLCDGCGGYRKGEGQGLGHKGGLWSGLGFLGGSLG